MRKTAWIVVLMLMLVTVMAACDSATTVQPTEEKKVLKFYLRAISKASVTGELIEQYNAIQDDVTIEFEVFGENYRNVISIALLSDDTPDIFELNGGLTVSELAMGGHIIPIDVYVTEELRSEFYPQVFMQKQLYYEDRLYAIPERLAYFKLLYNKGLFEAAGLDSDKGPESLEEMVEYARIITEKGKGEYYGYGLPLRTGSTFGRYLNNIAVFGGLPGKDGYNWETGRFDYAPYDKIFESLIQMKNDGSLYPNPFSLDVEVSRALFGEGKFAMMIDGSWMPAIYNNNEVKMTQDWAVADIPVFEGMKRQKGYLNYDMGRVISSTCPYPDEAWDFIEYMLENQDAYVRKGEPLRTKINTNDKDIFPEFHIGYEAFSDVENYRAFPYEIDFTAEEVGVDRNEIYRAIFLEEIPIGMGLDMLTEHYNRHLDEEDIQ